MIKNLILVTFTAFMLSGCFGGEKEEKWTAFIYPDKDNTKRNMKSPMTFDTLEMCKKEARNQLKVLGIEETATFKCGLNCSYHEGMKMEICEKMLKPNEEMQIKESKF